MRHWAGAWKVAGQSVQGSVGPEGGGASEGSAVTQAGTAKAVDSPEMVGCNGGSEEWLWEVVEMTQVEESLNREGGRERQ